MTFKRLMFASIVTGALAMTGLEAIAAPVTVVTWTGTVASGDRSGSPFRFVVTIDDNTPNVYTHFDSQQSVIYGGSCCNYGAPVTGIMYIDGLSESYSGAYFGHHANINTGTYNEVSSSVRDSLTVAADVYASGYGNPIGNNADYHQFGTFDVTGAATHSGSVTFLGATLELTPSTVTFSAAPEPATWALMMLGAGGMGAALRTGRRKVNA